MTAPADLLRQRKRLSSSCDKHSWACYVNRAAGEVGDAGIVAEALDIAEGRPVAVEDASDFSHATRRKGSS